MWGRHIRLFDTSIMLWWDVEGCFRGNPLGPSLRVKLHFRCPHTHTHTLTQTHTATHTPRHTHTHTHRDTHTHTQRDTHTHAPAHAHAHAHVHVHAHTVAT